MTFKALAFALVLFACCASIAPAQESPAASPVASPTPSATPPSKAGMDVPKGWQRVQGDSVATMVFRSPSAPQDIRIAKMGVTTEFDGDAGVAKVRAMVAQFPFASTDVSRITVCAYPQPAILTVAKDAQQQVVMEQIVVAGKMGGAIVTYEISDGKPDPVAESAIRSICVP